MTNQFIKKPSALVTAGNDGIGKELVRYFEPNSKSLSRSNGFDIRDSEVRSRIAQMSLGYDIFFNHAFASDGSQTLLLNEIFEVWKLNNKFGFIFSTGTYGTYFSEGINADYIRLKSELDELSNQLNQKIKYEKLNFKICLLRMGMLDTERSRSKPHWPGYGLKGLDVAKVCEQIYHLPNSVLIPDLVIEARAEV